MPMAERLDDAYNNLSVEPLRDAEEFRDFYVERPIDQRASTIMDLKDSIEIASKKDVRRDKYLFLGFRGSGKSTELNRLKDSLDNARFLVVCYSIRNELNMSDFDFRDFFLSMTLKIYDTITGKNIDIHPDIEIELEKFIKDITKIKEEEITRNASAGISLPALVTLKLSRECKTRETVRKELDQKVSDLIQMLNWLIIEIESETKKRLVVLVDDLDKLTRGQQSEDFFYKNYELLLQPNCFIVYTFPIPLAFHPKYVNVKYAFTDEVILLQIPVVDRHNDAIPENKKFYEDVISRRMKCDLFEEGVLDKAIESTGKLSELVEVVRDATLKAYRARKERISMIELESALEKLRMTYDRTLTEAHKKKLLEIYHSKEARDEDSDSLIIRELLFSLNAVEYYDSEGRWCTIDPLLLPLVEKWSRSPEKV